MSDPADLAQEQTDAYLRHAVARRKDERKPKATGYCGNCNEPLEHPRVFCDGDCRDDYEARIASRTARGPRR